MSAINLVVADDPAKARNAIDAAGRGEYTHNATDYGAVGDGVTDDTAAFNTIPADVTAFLTKGSTYAISADLTLAYDLDLNGATLDIGGDLILDGHSIWGGSITSGGTVQAVSETDFHVTDLVITVTNSAETGLLIEGSTFFTVKNVTVHGPAWRGINIDTSDDFLIEDCYVENCPDTGAYGILVFAPADGTVHGRGRIIRPTVVDTDSGICINGGEADSGQPGYTGAYVWDTMLVADAVCRVTDPADGYFNGLWATNTRNLTYLNPRVDHGADLGVDFEHCIDSQCLGGTVTDCALGALGAIFGSVNCTFRGVDVVYTVAGGGSGSTVGVTWVNTSNIMILVRDATVDVGFYNCTFRSIGGALGQCAINDGGDGVTVCDCDFHNGYIVTPNPTPGDLVDTRIVNNRFFYDVNINNPAIYAERVSRHYVDGNVIQLKSGEVPESALRAYICVYDADANYSDNVYLRRNTIRDPAGNSGMAGVALYTGSASVNAWITDNVADRVGLLTGALYPNVRYSGNVKSSAVGPVHPRNWDTTAQAVLPTRRTVTASTDLTAADTMCFANGDTITVSLPDPADGSDDTYIVKNLHSSSLTVDSQGSTKTIDGAATKTLAQWAAVACRTDGTQWYTV